MRRGRLVAWLTGLAGLVVVAALASLAIGAKDLSLGQSLGALWHGGSGPDAQIVRGLRVPRTLVGLVAGMALGLAGALIQGCTRNPIADAGLLGLNAGAAFCAVLAIHFLGLAGPGQYVWFAFAGAGAAGAAVYAAAIAAGRGAPTPTGLALGGAALTFLLQAVTNAVLLQDPAALDRYRFWVVGSVAGRGPDVLEQLWPFFAAGALLAAMIAPRLNVLALGDDVARGLGTNVARTRGLGMVAIVLLSGAATAACGPIAFVGLAVAQLARAVTGPDHRWLLPFSALLGAVALLTADIVGRVVAQPGEVSVGIVAALAGAPLFVAVVRRNRLVRL